MKYLTLFLFLVLLTLGCSEEEEEEKEETILFLNFPSGIQEDEFIALANKNPNLIIKDLKFPEYKWEMFLKSSSIKTELRPIFQLNSNKLYRIYIQGQPKSNSELIEIETMLLEKYKMPKTTMAPTNIRISHSSCLIWTIEHKEICFCRDSIPQSSTFDAMFGVADGKSNKQSGLDSRNELLYFFELSYTDKKIENENLNSRTKEQL